MAAQAQQSLKGEILIVFLAFVSVGLLVFEAVSEMQPHQAELFEKVDLTIACIFLAEWIYRFVRSDDRKRFVAKSWWELLAAIPLTNEMTRTLRGMRLLRVIRVIRILRVVRLGVRIHIIVQRMRAFGDSTQMVTIISSVTMIVLTAAVAFHYFEFGTNQNVKSFGDSLWWAFITITTVGYGDIFPVTPEGRIIAVLLLVIGLASFGVFTASIASWLTKRSEGEDGQ